MITLLIIKNYTNFNKKRIKLKYKNKVIKTKRLERTLDIQISEETYKKLRGVIIGE